MRRRLIPLIALALLPVLAWRCGPEPYNITSCALVFHFPDYPEGNPLAGIPYGWSSGLADPVGTDYTSGYADAWLAKCRDVSPVSVLKITGAANSPSGPRAETYLNHGYLNPRIRWVTRHVHIDSVDTFNKTYFFTHRESEVMPRI